MSRNALIFYVIGLAVALEAAPAPQISTETIYGQQRSYNQGCRNCQDHHHHSHYSHRHPHGNYHHHPHGYPGHRFRDNAQYYPREDPPFCASCSVDRGFLPQYFAESSNGRDSAGEIYGYQRRYARSGEPSQFKLSSEIRDAERIDDGLSAEPIDELISTGDLQAVDPSAETLMYVVRPFDGTDTTDLNSDDYSEDIVSNEEFTTFPISMKKVEGYPTRMFTEKEVEEIVRTAIKTATEKRRSRIKYLPEMQEVRTSILPFDREGLEPANVVRRPAAEIRRGLNSYGSIRDRMNIPKMLERMDKLSMRDEQLQTPSLELGDESIVREGDIVLSNIGTKDELNENDFGDDSKLETEDLTELRTIGLTATKDTTETVKVKEDSNIATTDDVNTSSTSAETLIQETTSEAPMTTII